MTKEQYNSLAPLEKEVYDKCNKRNRSLLITSWVITAVFTVISLIVGITQGDPITGFGIGWALGFVFGSLFPGFAHLGFIFKKIKLNTAILLWIVLGLFIMILYGIILMVVWYGGMVCIVVDTILFIMKKPLIYSWEDKRVLAKAAERALVQAVQSGQIGQVVPAAAPSNVDQLNELTQMLNSGLITQEEFNAKKAEMMSRM